MMHRSVLAIAAHPDDIEFVMAGTLLQFAARGWKVHYFNLANGCYGSTTLSREECTAARLAEAQNAAALIPAEFHPPICDDLDIFYTAKTLAQVSAIVRQARPSVVLTHSLIDYMEDHQNTARLAVGGAFTRGMPNFASAPPMPYFFDDVAVYHAQPHGNRTPLGERVVPTHFVDATDLMAKKRELLAAHRSQQAWLDDSQRISSYLQTMEDLNREVGGMSNRFEFAEGWRQHLHLGFAAAEFDPLRQVLGEAVVVRKNA